MIKRHVISPTPRPLQIEGYDPNALLDHLLKVYGLKNDADLGRLLQVQFPVLSKVRHRVIAISCELLVRIHDATGISLDDLRDLAGIPRIVAERVEQP